MLWCGGLSGISCRVKVDIELKFLKGGNIVMPTGNPFAKAFEAKAKELAEIGLEVKVPEDENRWFGDPNRVPRMYRAQIKGRCSLHNAQRENKDLNIWTAQWTYPQANGEARYQRSEPKLGQDGDVYRIAVKFPFRLFSNGGQDSIMRPMLGKDGIPFLPGSSVKGLFLRACDKNGVQAAKYCGREVRQQGKLQHLPGEVPLRFLGAYPVGNWADRVVDLVHPQKNRQVGTANREEGASASAMISLYQPRMVFEFSCGKEGVDWKEVERILVGALQLGVGGKTSSGYGLGGNLPGKPLVNPESVVNVLMKGVGVSSVLRDGVTPEFRTNLFKAGLRGHLRRLLAGIDEQKAEDVADRWFGSTRRAAGVMLLWQERREVKFADVNRVDRNPTYDVEGILYANIQKRRLAEGLTEAQVQRQYEQDRALLKQLVVFAYVMGGFGKSWRRVWHGLFRPEYHAKHFAIGCHWSSLDLDGIQSVADLKAFLDALQVQCCEYLGVRVQNARSASWREAWSPKRVVVFCRKGSGSAAVGLFHDETFKTTPAIGGRKPHSDHPKKFCPPQNVSSVWHRMLPLRNGTEYLEIVTLFYGDRDPWKRDGMDQLLPFIQALKDQGLKLAWGTEPIS
jgi:CRISPR-associated protein Cmr6